MVRFDDSTLVKFADESKGATLICERVLQCLSRRQSGRTAARQSSSEAQVASANMHHVGSVTGQQSNTIDHHLNSGINRLASSDVRIGPCDPSADATTSIIRQDPTTPLTGFLSSIGQHGSVSSANGDTETNALPFEGYNLEELWDWMLLMDSGGDLHGSGMNDWYGIQ